MYTLYTFLSFLKTASTDIKKQFPSGLAWYHVSGISPRVGCLCCNSYITCDQSPYSRFGWYFGSDLGFDFDLDLDLGFDLDLGLDFVNLKGDY